MSRKGESIYKRRDGRWEGRYIKGRSSQGKAIYGYVYAPDYRAAKIKLCKAVTEVDSGSAISHKSISNRITFDMVANGWLTALRPQLKESTYFRYKNLLDSYILPHWDGAFVEQITANDLDDYCNQLLENGGIHHDGLSAKSVADILSVIRQIINYACTQNIQPLCTGKEVSVRQAPKETRILTHSEQDLLCRYLIQNISYRNLGILICLSTGLRIGELCALRWEDISFQEKTIYVHQTLQRIRTDSSSEKKTKVTVTSPKSKCSIRVIPIPDDIMKILEKMSTSQSEYILSNKSGRYVEPRTMQNHFQKVLKEAGIEPINFHSLRHTFATRCIEVGFDIKSLSEVLGHANVNITMNRYVHPTMELKRENMQRLSGVFLVK